jgi:hypothetical protein
MAVAALAVIVISVALALQDEAVFLFVSPCALLVEVVGLVGELLSVAYGPDLAAKHIHVGDSGPLLFVGSEVASYVDCVEPLAHELLDAAIVLVALTGIYGWSVVQREAAQPAGLNNVVMIAWIVVAPLMVGNHMVRVDVCCRLPRSVYHGDGVLSGLIVLVALCTLELSRVCSLSAGFVHGVVSRDAYRGESDGYLPPNRRIPYAAVLPRHPSHLGTNHLPPVDLYND